MQIFRTEAKVEGILEIFAGDLSLSKVIAIVDQYFDSEELQKLLESAMAFDPLAVFLVKRDKAWENRLKVDK